ncbi:unnamed protein product [Caenorhabditis auriculariae]|uniref:Uncharacterized protein n=1 Tax=Caenorhabditis auriculariae TaxID=2777116 RepID=A0A8S1HRX6_9PELO|nr:unnamed protein product [Caenorhabditis auriculariae]
MEVPPDEEEPMEDEPQEPVLRRRKKNGRPDFRPPKMGLPTRKGRRWRIRNRSIQRRNEKRAKAKKWKIRRRRRVDPRGIDTNRPPNGQRLSRFRFPTFFDNDSGSNSSASATPTIKKKAVSTLAKPPSKPKLPPPPQMITTKHKWSAMMAEYKREKQMTEEATTSSPKTRISEPSTSSATQPPSLPTLPRRPQMSGKTVLDEIIGDKPVVLTKPDWRKTTKPAPKKEQNADVLGQIFTAQEQSLKQRRLDEERRNPPRTEPDLKPLRSADTTPRPQNPEKVYSETSLLPPPPPPPRIKGNASPPPPPPPKDLQMAPAPPVGVKRRSRFDQPPPEVVAQQTYMMHMAHMGMGPPPFPMMPPPPWMMGMPPPVGAPPFVAPPAALPAPRPVAALPPPPPTPNSKPNSASNSSSNTPIMKPSPVIAQSPVTSRSPPPPPPPPKRSNISGTPTAVFEAKAEKSPPPPPPPRPPKVEKEEEPVVLPPPPPFPKPRAEEPPAAVLRDWLPLEARSASNRAPTEEETREKDKFKSFLENLHNSVFHEDPASNEEEEAEDKEDEINGQVESERLEGGREPLPTTSEQPTDAEDVKDEDEEEEFVIRDTTVDVENGTQEETRQVVTEVAPSCEEKSTAVVPTSAAEEPIVEYDPLENTSCCETDFYVYEPSFRKGEGEEIVMDVEHEEDVYNEEEQEYEEGHEVQKEEEEEEPAEEPMEEEPEIDLTDANARRDLLMRAMPLLQSFNVVEKEKEVPEEEAPQDLYCQLSQNNEEFERTKEDTEVYYHGEPVPDDDDMNLFEVRKWVS